MDQPAEIRRHRHAGGHRAQQARGIAPPRVRVFADVPFPVVEVRGIHRQAQPLDAFVEGRRGDLHFGDVAGGARGADDLPGRVAQGDRIERKVHRCSVAAQVPRFVVEQRLARENRVEYSLVAPAHFIGERVGERPPEHVPRLAAPDAAHRRPVEIGPAAGAVDRPDQVVGGLDQVAVHLLACAQRALRGPAVLGIRERKNRGGFRTGRIQGPAEAAAPHGRAVLAHHARVVLDDAAAGKPGVGVGAHRLPGLVRSIQEPGRLPGQLPRGISEHQFEPAVAAHDGAVLDESDTHREDVEHDVFLRQHGLVRGLGALRFGDVGEYRDDAAKRRADRLALQPAAAARAVLAQLAIAGKVALRALADPLLAVRGLGLAHEFGAVEGRFGNRPERRAGQVLGPFSRRVHRCVFEVARDQPVVLVIDGDAVGRAVDRVAQPAFALAQPFDQRHVLDAGLQGAAHGPVQLRKHAGHRAGEHQHHQGHARIDVDALREQHPGSRQHGQRDESAESPPARRINAGRSDDHATDDKHYRDPLQGIARLEEQGRQQRPHGARGERAERKAPLPRERIGVARA